MSTDSAFGWFLRIPGHAFVGWHPAPEDKARPGAIYFVETTAVHSAQFEQAVAYAGHVVDTEMKAGHFKQGVLGPSFMLELTDLRRLGFKAQPID